MLKVTFILFPLEIVSGGGQSEKENVQGIVLEVLTLNFFCWRSKREPNANFAMVGNFAPEFLWRNPTIIIKKTSRLQGIFS